MDKGEKVFMVFRKSDHRPMALVKDYGGDDKVHMLLIRGWIRNTQGREPVQDEHHLYAVEEFPCPLHSWSDWPQFA